MKAVVTRNQRLARRAMIKVTLGGYRVLRFAAFVLRYSPDFVARKVRDALRQVRPAMTG